jgi:serine/threonine-protein kinase
LIGQLAGEYRILRKLGAGGFGTVYEAEHPLLKRKAAVEVLHSSPAVNSVAVQRFIAEARSASQIRHPTSSTSSRSARCRTA